MRRYFFLRLSLGLLCLVALLACSCTGKQLGPRGSVTVPGAAPFLQKKKVVFLTLSAPLGEDLEEVVPQQVAAQLAVLTKPYAAAVFPSDKALRRDEALAAAQSRKADYVFYVTMMQWRAASFTHFGSRGEFAVEVLDAASGATQLTGNINGWCQVGVFERPDSPSRCIAPEYARWLFSVFP